ncbi:MULTISPECIES: helix-turn-helix domain-containing protein [unclassified Carboxylicivirga]|uniref:helix-turn-helix domain-containing protein n=1 Tax=Carboxylicivirga TaxID=1628153 RepID=UPI003D3455F9
MERIILDIKEGPAQNYIDALYNTFGGQRTPGVYTIKNAALEIYLTVHQLYKDIELIVVEAKSNKVLVVNRIVDNDPDYIHINIFKEGQLTQRYSERQEHVEVGTSKGLFAHNGLFPLVAEFPADCKFRSIGLKFRKEALMALLPESKPTYDVAFGSGDPIAYRTILSKEIERITDDIFYFREIEFGKRSLVIARGIEALTAIWFMAKNNVEAEELQGLHIDDYKRLLKIKDRLTQDFSQRITIEEIAANFGVSTSKLKRDFKTLYDCSIYQFYTHAKMDEAYRRLKTGDYSVMEVGYDLGYQNLSKFSAMFKKVKGLSPKDVLKIRS